MAILAIKASGSAIKAPGSPRSAKTGKNRPDKGPEGAEMGQPPTPELTDYRNSQEGREVGRKASGGQSGLKQVLCEKSAGEVDESVRNPLISLKYPVGD